MIESPATIKAFALLAQAGIRADNVTAVTVGRVLDQHDAQSSLPHFQHDKAEQIGLALHDYWTRIIGDKVPDRDDLAWADIIQFIVRESNTTE
ncbi:MAG: hypothetical protein JHD10_03345 [Sphingomonadaceae bacterium]|nr:hypothetical protein [Sphingomonadaceae bacterium]